MRGKTLIVQDFRFQFRSRIHPIYLAVSAFYIIILKLLPAGWMKILFPAVILTDPALMGFLFIGAILFFERDQGLFPLLSITPVTIMEYLFSKVISLTAIATGTSLIIGMAVMGLNLNYPLLIIGTALTAALFTLLGIWIALKFKNVGSFLVLSGGIDIPIILPILSTIGVWDSPLLFLLPTRGTLVFLEGAAGTPQTPLKFLAGSLILLIWIFIAYKGAYHSIEREFTLLPGDQNE
ncbi:MAG: hypothetical protein JEY99_14400 [Spirochaetales bacterium]|nr:hypothetical protein [Spirochaetales bacterium]